LLVHFLRLFLPARKILPFTNPGIAKPFPETRRVKENLPDVICFT
jgi:hypothetical protein